MNESLKRRSMGVLEKQSFWGWATVVSFAVTVILLLVFRANPQWDVAISSWFFVAQACETAEPSWRVCGTFPLVDSPFWDGLRNIGMTTPRAVMVLTLLALMSAFVFSAKPDRGRIQVSGVGLISLFLGPLLITNWILKEFWGRARPFQTTEFGGLREFSLPGTIVDECARNCSFVSGEAAAAFWLLWLVPLLPAAWRVGGGALLLVFAIFVAGLRVAFGRHFFSDVTIGATLSVTCICFAYWYAATPLAQRTTDAFLNWGERMALPLHRWSRSSLL